MAQDTQPEHSWFNRAAKSSVLNAVWLGPLNIYFWFSADRFGDPYYERLARTEQMTIDDVIGTILIVEMVLMVFSLFVVSSIFYGSKAKPTFFTSIICLVCATLLWNGLSTWLEL